MTCDLPPRRFSDRMVSLTPSAMAHAAWAFGRTRWLAHTLRRREDVEAWRTARLRTFLQRTAPRARFYAAYAGAPLETLPIIDKAMHMAAFEHFNVRGVTHAQARAALDRGEERVGDLYVGQSTGTSGNRGVYVISESERLTWLGVMLAKALPDVLTTRHRVALALPGYSQLYASAAHSRALTLRFFPLQDGVASWSDAMADYAPDVIVAPPKVLRALAETQAIAPRHVFSGAEVLDPLDRAIVEAAFKTPVREIYMATEGLFGVACKHGVLHLAEDAVAFEWESAPGSDLVKPLITDFTRRTQIMARYRMNDLLRLSSEPCACGSPLQAVDAVLGRQDDIFVFGAAMITPDVMRNAVVDADRRILDFRIVQTGAAEIELALPDVPDGVVAAAKASLAAALARAGAVGVSIDTRQGIATPYDRKLRRVERAWRP